MKKIILKTIATFHAILRNSIGPASARHPFVLVTLALVCLGLSPHARAVCQEGCDLGNFNTFLGDDALDSNTTGAGNTAIGSDALLNNTTGNLNTASGAFALVSNTTGTNNTATGISALVFNTTGGNNTATGFNALYSNTTGGNNMANGVDALYSNTTGFSNTATGVSALHSNTTGQDNTATGLGALYSNTTGFSNTATGVNALHNTTTGSSNIAVSHSAGFNLTTGNNNIDIGSFGLSGEANTIRIGGQGTQTATFIAGISGTGVMGVAVKVNAAGQIGTAPSAARFKENIKQMDKASEAIHALKPVTFRYKQELDPDGIPQFGLVAEQVEKVNPDLVARDASGKVYTVRYEAVNAMLLNEFLKEHRTVQELKSTVAKQEAKIARQEKDFQSKLADQQKQIKALTSGLEKVSAQLELSKTAPQTVLNNQ